MALFCTGVRREEIVHCVSSRVNSEDLRIGDDDPFDRTRVEQVIDEVLADLVTDGLFRRNEDGLHVLQVKGLQRATSLACLMNAQLPDHLLQELQNGR